MTNFEYRRLRKFEYAQKHRFHPTKPIQGRAIVKARALGKGTFFKRTSVTNSVPIEKVFVNRY